MGERVLVSIAERLQAGQGVESLRDLRGVAYLLGKNAELPESEHETRELPGFEAVKTDHEAFAIATRDLHHETNPFNGRRLLQAHGDRTLVINPADLPLDESEMDDIYDLPYTRVAHPSYSEPIPAHEMIKDSVTIMRGCFGGCTFCSITMHQGRTIQSRSEESILKEVEDLAATPSFKGHISDLGGPTANMYRMRCTKPEVEKICRRLSCVHPTICKLLGTDHQPTIDLMRKSRAIPGIKKVNIQSGVRTDLAVLSPDYLEELAAHHVGGHLKVAPEHTSPKVLRLMKKPEIGEFDEFAVAFDEASKRAGKEQYLVPYFIASHPGSNAEDMIEMAIFLKARGYKPLQVQDFIPAPMDIATCMHYTGLDPTTMEPVETTKKLKDRNMQRALMQYFAPENYFTVKQALLDSGRGDLIGKGPKCLIPTNPPREALKASNEARSKKSAQASSRDRSKPKKGKPRR
ncbi:UNVERIFIED_CONTAM: hypothetical protein GTU68_049718 [Idotea baltica]|nr:hypothetical protein [Idotea baltica]